MRQYPQSVDGAVAGSISAVINPSTAGEQPRVPRIMAVFYGICSAKFSFRIEVLAHGFFQPALPLRRICVMFKRYLAVSIRIGSRVVGVNVAASASLTDRHLARFSGGRLQHCKNNIIRLRHRKRDFI